MNKLILIILPLALYLTPLHATQNGQDSLRSFLEYIGEDSLTISKIMVSPETVMPMNTLNMYLMHSIKLEYNPTEQKMEWHCGWIDSVFARKSAEYLSLMIVQDTALYLIDPCLLHRFVTTPEPRYDEDILLLGAEYAICNFHAKEAILVPELYYDYHKELENAQKNQRFYSMIKFILTGSMYFGGFDKTLQKKFKTIVTNSDNSSLYYVQFRNVFNSYSDMDLARISKDQEEELVNILRIGAANGEKKSQLTYAFMLITGQFVEKDEVLGNEILSRLLNQGQ